jgi:hypothetical protein
MVEGVPNDRESSLTSKLEREPSFKKEGERQGERKKEKKTTREKCERK